MPAVASGGRGKVSEFDAVACLAWWRARQGPGSNEQERTRYFKASADKIEQEIRKRAGELIEASEVDQRWAGQVLALRERLLALPTLAVQRGLLGDARGGGRADRAGGRRALRAGAARPACRETRCRGPANAFETLRNSDKRCRKRRESRLAPERAGRARGEDVASARAPAPAHHRRSGPIASGCCRPRAARSRAGGARAARRT